MKSSWLKAYTILEELSDFFMSRFSLISIFEVSPAQEASPDLRVCVPSSPPSLCSMTWLCLLYSTHHFLKAFVFYSVPASWVRVCVDLPLNSQSLGQHSEGHQRSVTFE